jgi:hypothetical protein
LRPTFGALAFQPFGGKDLVRESQRLDAVKSGTPDPLNPLPGGMEARDDVLQALSAGSRPARGLGRPPHARERIEKDY